MGGPGGVGEDRPFLRRGGEGRGGIGKYATCVMRQQDTHSREGKEEGKLKHYKTARAEPRTRPREVLY